MIIVYSKIKKLKGVRVFLGWAYCTAFGFGWLALPVIFFRRVPVIGKK